MLLHIVVSFQLDQAATILSTLQVVKHNIPGSDYMYHHKCDLQLHSASLHGLVTVLSCSLNKPTIKPH